MGRIEKIFSTLFLITASIISSMIIILLIQDIKQSQWEIHEVIVPLFAILVFKGILLMCIIHILKINKVIDE